MSAAVDTVLAWALVACGVASLVTASAGVLVADRRRPRYRGRHRAR